MELTTRVDRNGNLLHTCEKATVSGIKAEVIRVVYQLYLRVPAIHLGAVGNPAFRQKVSYIADSKANQLRTLAS